LLKTKSQSNNPLDIAEDAEMDKGAFNRCLKSLEDQGLVKLKRDGSKLSQVKLSSEGKKVARLFEEKLNSELAKLHIPQDLDTTISRIRNDVAPK
jgi:DNA-binding MarR family transcriptional regulator